MPNPARIIDMASAFYDSCVLFTASDLGVFAKLAETGEADADTLARELQLSPRGALLLLDACVALELLEKNGEIYRNSEDAAVFLTPNSPADLSKAIRYNRDVYAAWGKLRELAKTGLSVEKPEIHLGEDEQRTRDFVLSMHGRALGIGQAVVPQLDLSGCKKLFDVGGGPGTYSALIARRWPEIECTVLDLPGVVRVADELLAAQGMSGKVKTLAGDYRVAEFPAGNDAVIFFGMLHQESPDSIRDLFKRAHISLNPGGVVYVMDMMTDRTHARPKFSALFAVNMALTTENGWVFSDAELGGWLKETGFCDFSVKPLAPPMPHWLACARKA
jgi:SAM-dependent methyltransferase